MRFVRRGSIVAPAAVAVLALVAVALTASNRGREPVYTVAQVNRGLAQHPTLWLGRTVRVRGQAIIPMKQGEPACCGGVLADPATPTQRIRLAWHSVSPLLTLALRLPLLKTVAVTRVGGIGVYRVLLMRAIGIVPAPGLPHYYPYTSRTIAMSYVQATLVSELN